MFGKARHNFREFLELYGCDQVQAYQAILKDTEEYIRANGITGSFENIVITVNGIDITVRGIVIDGVVHIGTAFIP